jgi:hypothetical protein
VCILIRVLKKSLGQTRIIYLSFVSDVVTASSWRYLWPREEPLLSSKRAIRLPANKEIIGHDEALMSKVFILTRMRSRGCPAFRAEYLALLE